MSSCTSFSRDTYSLATRDTKKWKHARASRLCFPPSSPRRYPGDRFNPFSISLSKRHIHIYERQESKKDSRAPSPTCKVRACKYLRGHVHTFQPFIDLLTRRHPRPSFFSAVLSLCVCVRMRLCVCVFAFFLFFFSVDDIVSRYQKSQPRGSRIIERAVVAAAASISRIYRGPRIS